MLKPVMAFDALVLNLTIGEKSIHFIYSIHPLSKESRSILQDSLAGIFSLSGVR